MADTDPGPEPVVVVTGASGGIGQAVVRAFVATGSTVALVGRNAQRLEAVRQALPGGRERTVALPCDVGLPEQVAGLAAALRERWGRISVLCTCAGLMRTGRLDETTEQTWKELLATNVTGTFLTIKNLVPLMANPSCIITVASTAGLRPVEGFTAYTSTKAAIIQMTQGCAVDYASRGIRVNCICPGVVRTPIHQEIDSGQWPTGDMFYDAMTQATPLGYLGEPQDIAHVVRFLADPASHWITGSVLVVDGGLSLL